MQRPSRVIVLLMVLVLVECAEVHVDEDVVCFVPPNCPCGDNPSTSPCEWSCPGGEFPAETAFQAVALVGECEGDFEAFSCHVTQTGDLELTLDTSWQAVPSDRSLCIGDDLLECDSVPVDCGETPTLAAGTWTVKYGSSTHVFVVPNSDPTHPAQPSNCFRDGD